MRPTACRLMPSNSRRCPSVNWMWIMLQASCRCRLLKACHSYGHVLRIIQRQVEKPEGVGRWSGRRVRKAGQQAAETESSPCASAETLTRTIPGAKHQVLDGQQHNIDPKVLAPALIAFFAA